MQLYHIYCMDNDLLVFSQRQVCMVARPPAFLDSPLAPCHSFAQDLEASSLPGKYASMRRQLDERGQQGPQVGVGVVSWLKGLVQTGWAALRPALHHPALQRNCTALSSHEFQGLGGRLPRS